MTIITDNVRKGAVVGTGAGVYNPTKLQLVESTPNNVVTGAGSAIAVDATGSVYMCRPAGGSTWIKLGSLA